MRLIDADKIDYYTLERDGKNIGQMVWKPHIDGMPTINLQEIREQAFRELRNKINEYIKEHDSSTLWKDLDGIIDEVQGKDIILNWSPDNLLASLQETQKDQLYRKLWMGYVVEDVKARCEDTEKELTEEEVLSVAEDYIYQGDYDCNLSYWDNIDNLIDEYIQAREEKKSPEDEMER